MVLSGMSSFKSVSRIISQCLELPTRMESLLSELRLPSGTPLSLRPRGFDKEEADCDFEQKFGRTWTEASWIPRAALLLTPGMPPFEAEL